MIRLFVLVGFVGVSLIAYLVTFEAPPETQLPPAKSLLTKFQALGVVPDPNAVVPNEELGHEIFAVPEEDGIHLAAAEEAMGSMDGMAGMEGMSGMKMDGDAAMKPEGEAAMTPPAGTTMQMDGEAAMTPHAETTMPMDGEAAMTPPAGAAMQMDGGAAMTPHAETTMQMDGDAAMTPPAGTAMQMDSGAAMTPPAGTAMQMDGDAAMTPPAGTAMPMDGDAAMTPPAETVMPMDGDAAMKPHADEPAGLAHADEEEEGHGGGADLNILAEGAPVDREIEIVMTEWAYSPGSIEVKPGERILLKIRNGGQIPHEFMFMSMPAMAAVGYRAQRADWNLLEHEALYERSLVLPGQDFQVAVKIEEPGVWMFMCMFPYHMQFGMMGGMATPGMSMQGMAM